MSPRSATAIARARAASKAWARTDDGRAWHRAYRARHAAHLAELRATWRDEHPDLIAAQGARYRALVVPPIPIPDVLLSHPFLTAARLVADDFAHPDGRATMTDDLYPELVAVAALAIVAGDDPTEAVRLAASAARAWARITAELEPER